MMLAAAALALPLSAAQPSKKTAKVKKQNKKEVKASKKWDHEQVVELEASPPVAGLQDTGTDRNRVLCRPSGTSRLIMKAEKKSVHISPNPPTVHTRLSSSGAA